MRGYGGTRFVWNLVMSTLSASSKRSDAVGNADRVDAASQSASLFSAVERHRQQRTDRARVSPSASSQARRKYRTVDLWIQRSVRERESVLQDPMMQRSSCRPPRFNNTQKHEEREKGKKADFYPAFPAFSRLAHFLCVSETEQRKRSERPRVVLRRICALLSFRPNELNGGSMQ